MTRREHRFTFTVVPIIRTTLRRANVGLSSIYSAFVNSCCQISNLTVFWRLLNRVLRLSYKALMVLNLIRIGWRGPSESPPDFLHRLPSLLTGRWARELAPWLSSHVMRTCVRTICFFHRPGATVAVGPKPEKSSSRSQSCRAEPAQC